MYLFFKRFCTISIALFSAIILTGCFGGSSDDETATTVNFDGLTVSIPVGYNEVPGSLIENKQILNKVIKSFKLTEDEGYIDNIIITKSLIAPTISSEQFATANLDKLQENIIGFVPGEQLIDTMSCGEQTIETLRHSFSIKDNFYEHASEYFVDQFQFVYNKQGYIISYASDEDEKKITKAFTAILKSFECDPLPSAEANE